VKRRLEISSQLADYENLRRDVERYAPQLLERENAKNMIVGR
jgi:hypothetical protein